MAFIKNLNAWIKKGEAAKKKVRTSATLFVQNKVMIVYKEALRVSPQWSGNYVYNWQIEFTGAEASAYDKRFKVEPWTKLRGREHKAGDKEAVAQNLIYNTDLVKQIKWNSKIKLINKAPVADLIEAGKVRFRPENLITPTQGIIAYLNVKYKYLGKN